ncbi:MAG: hypothetical protein AAGK23_00450 [Pseudomonadota bacterium]
MPYRILLELLIFLSPFAVFGLYRMAITDAEAEGRKAWPINALFVIGFVLALALWIFFILREDRDRGVCQTQPGFDPVTRELIPVREFPCDANVEDIGIPRSEDPGARPEPQSSGAGEDAPATPQ